MKVLIVLLSIFFLLAGLPILHGYLVFLSIDKQLLPPAAASFFYLFTIPSWAVAIMVFVVETYRRSFIQMRTWFSNTLILGIAGMIAPCIGLALSPVATDIKMQAYTGIATTGLVLGLLGAVIFNFIVSLTKNK